MLFDAGYCLCGGAAMWGEMRCCVMGLLMDDRL